MQHITVHAPLTSGGVDDVPLWGCDTPKHLDHLVRLIIAVNLSAGWIIDHIHRRSAPVAVAHLFGVSGSRHNHIEISGLEPLLYFPTMHIAVGKSGVQRKALVPGGAPQVSFVLGEGEKAEAVYAYCNLHGLWMTEL